MNSRRLLAAVVLAAIGGVYYFCNTQVNPVTGEKQHVALSPQDEVALGLQAAPQMAQEFGGLYPDRLTQEYVRSIGQKLVSASDAKRAPYPFDFHLLTDPETVNAFALPGGQVFLTAGLLKRLGSEGQLAGVLGHEIGHVVERHSAEHLAKQQFTQVLVGAAAVAGSDDSSGGRHAAAIAAMVGSIVNLKFSRNDEIEADRSGVALLALSGYDPRALAQVMEVLQKTTGRSSKPEFLSTHPDPGDRKTLIEAEIARLYPAGPPPSLGSGDAHAFAVIEGRLGGSGTGEGAHEMGGGHHPDSQEN